MEFRTTTDTGGSLATAMTIDENQRVGIGDTTPTEGKLVVSGVGTAGAPALHLQLSRSDTFNHFANMINPNLTAGENGIIVFGQEAASKNAAWIGYKHRSDHGDDNQLSLGFWGANNLVNLLPNGKFGIGTETPSYKLDIVGDNTTTTAGGGITSRIINNGGGTATQYIITGNSTTGDAITLYAAVGGTNWYVGLDDSDSDKFKIGTSLTDASWNHLVVESGGNVGIGETSPSFPLDVVASANTGDPLTQGSAYQLGIRNSSSNTGAATSIAFGHETFDFSFFILSLIHI